MLRATRRGGIYDKHSQLNVSGIEIKGNTADDFGEPISGHGAGLVVDHDNATVTQTYFHNNVATIKGAEYTTPMAVL